MEIFRTLWNDREDFSWLLSRNSTVGYLGWLNRGNLGDESMFVAHQTISPTPLRRLPIQSVGLYLAAKSSVKTLVLGGGTLLGRKEWGVRLERAIDAFKPERVLTFGVGVEEPEFALSRGIITEAELLRQAAILKSFDRVGVRGPRAQKHLAELGVQSEILGDPALVLQSRSTSQSNTPRPVRVLLSLAEIRDGYEPHADQMRREVAQAARRVADNLGGELLGLAMEPADFQALRRADNDLRVIRLTKGVPSVVEAIAESTLVISERLHPNIIAAAVGTKFLAIGYKPKTYDFAESVGAESLIVDSRNVSKEDLVSRAHAILDNNSMTIATKTKSLANSFKRAVESELG